MTLIIGGGFSGVYFDKYNAKQNIINARDYVYDFFTRDTDYSTLTKTDETVTARYFSESKTADKGYEFDDLKQYSSKRVLPETSDYCHDFLIYGNPGYNVTNKIYKTNLYLCRDGYVVGYNYQTKQPSWVAFQLTKSKVANKLKRDDKFKSDGDIPFVYRSENSDYKKSGYDRGHLASYASMDFSKKSADESFLLSNMSPQKAGLNRQGWERLETDERIWANMYDSIYVYTGPIYKKQKVHKTIGDNKVAVPNYYFKIIYVPSKNKAIAFVMPNSTVKKNQIAKYRTSIKDIESRTGLQFLTGVDDRSDIVNKVSDMWRTSYF